MISTHLNSLFIRALAHALVCDLSRVAIVVLTRHLVYVHKSVTFKLGKDHTFPIEISLCYKSHRCIFISPESLFIILTLKYTSYCV